MIHTPSLSALTIFAASALVASLVLSLFHPFGNPHLTAIPAEKPMLPGVPPEVRSLLLNKCADCHSDQPSEPLYSHLAPASWLLDRHIINGRKALNLSKWESYSIDQQQVLLAKIIQQTRTRQMPMLQYRIVHRGSAISDADLHALARWSHQLAGFAEPPSIKSAELTSAAPTPPVLSKEKPVSNVNRQIAETSRPPLALSATPDAEHGKAVYEKRCSDCHAMNSDGDGPHLQGLFGRVAGSISTFEYSEALKKSHIVWSATTLDPWLADPTVVVPDTTMDLRVPKPQDRADLIEYLKRVSK